MLLEVERHEFGPRVRVLGHRWHHYTSGMALIALGVWLIFDDRKDLPWRLS